MLTQKKRVFVNQNIFNSLCQQRRENDRNIFRHPPKEATYRKFKYSGHLFFAFQTKFQKLKLP